MVTPTASLRQLDMIGIGNAIVDVLGQCDEAFLARHDIPKGGMLLIDAAQRARIYEAMTAVETIAGGAAANTIACFAALGGHAGFIGKVADDALGDAFRQSIQSLDIAFESTAFRGDAEDKLPTGQCLVHITPDAERSMTTFLGAAPFVTAADVIPDFISRASLLFLEGYLFEAPGAPAAFAKAADLIRAAGGKVAMTVSDAGCVARHFDSLTAFLKTHTDIVFANEREALALAQSESFEEALAYISDIARLIVITRSGKGCVVTGSATTRLDIPSEADIEVIDTTGAGDSFAAGFLFGHRTGLSLAASARLGHFVAAQIISQIGPRPAANLAERARAAGVISDPALS